MELKFTQKTRRSVPLTNALFLGVIFCTILATAKSLQYIPFALAGALLPLVPQIKGRKVRIILLIAWAVFVLVRFPVILDGAKLLANTLFRLSEETQSYEYSYFTTTGTGASEAVLASCLLAGILCGLWGNVVNVSLAVCWMAAMAYFGVTPSGYVLAMFLFAGVLTVLPNQQQWFHGGVALVLIAGIALGCVRLAPEPNKTISQWDEDLRDALAFSSVTYEQMPVPTEVPEPEIIPPPSIRQEQPDHGVQKKLINVLFLVLAALTLAILFIPAVIKDHAAKRSAQNREGLQSEEHSQAIHAMYSYAQRWRELGDNQPVPEDVYAIWQKAAFSDHPMTQQQRNIVHCYMVDTARRIWESADWKMRLRIRYQWCL